MLIALGSIEGADEPVHVHCPTRTRALTRILKTGVQDSHLVKSRSTTGKSGSPTQKKLESHRFVHTVYLFHFSRGDTFE